MARMPGADWQGEHGSVLMTEASLNKICIHTIVGFAPAHAAHLSVKANGWLFQSRDTKYRSAANLYGNDDVIAIECEDHGPSFDSWDTRDGHAVPGFTNQQIETIALAIVWGYEEHGIPIVPCPSSADSAEGIAFHRQGIDGNYISEGYAYGGRVAGGEVWSTSSGKVCPGDRRIKQLLEVIIPRARQLAGLDQEEDIMGEDARQIKAMLWTGGGVPGDIQPDTIADDTNRIKKMLWEGGDVPGITAPGTLADDLNVIRPKVLALETNVESLKAKQLEMDGKLDAIISLLQPPTEG